MQLISEKTFTNAKGQRMYMRALTEADSPHMTIEVYCTECCEKLAFRTFDARKTDAALQAALYGTADAMFAANHDCPKGGTC